MLSVAMIIRYSLLNDVERKNSRDNRGEFRYRSGHCNRNGRGWGSPRPNRAFLRKVTRVGQDFLASYRSLPLT
jgi:hypothetical protein